MDPSAPIWTVSSCPLLNSAAIHNLFTSSSETVTVTHKPSSTILSRQSSKARWFHFLNLQAQIFTMHILMNLKLVNTSIILNYDFEFNIC